MGPPLWRGIRRWEVRVERPSRTDSKQGGYVHVAVFHLSEHPASLFPLVYLWPATSTTVSSAFLSFFSFRALLEAVCPPRGTATPPEHSSSDPFTTLNLPSSNLFQILDPVLPLRVRIAPSPHGSSGEGSSPPRPPPHARSLCPRRVRLVPSLVRFVNGLGLGLFVTLLKFVLFFLGMADFLGVIGRVITTCCKCRRVLLRTRSRGPTGSLLWSTIRIRIKETKRPTRDLRRSTMVSAVNSLFPLQFLLLELNAVLFLFLRTNLLILLICVYSAFVLFVLVIQEIWRVSELVNAVISFWLEFLLSALTFPLHFADLGSIALKIWPFFYWWVSAYEVLSDSEKRKIYDRYGEEGLKQYAGGGGRGSGMNIQDIFNR